MILLSKFTVPIGWTVILRRTCRHIYRGVTTAQSARDALSRLESEVPDVIIADLGMPHLDGFRFITQVRRHPNPRIRGIPAAALTAYARSEDRMKALRAGFQIHLAKPVDPAELITTTAALAKRFNPEDSDDLSGTSVI